MVLLHRRRVGDLQLLALVVQEVHELALVATSLATIYPGDAIEGCRDLEGAHLAQVYLGHPHVPRLCCPHPCLGLLEVLQHFLLEGLQLLSRGVDVDLKLDGHVVCERPREVVELESQQIRIRKYRSPPITRVCPRCIQRYLVDNICGCA